MGSSGGPGDGAGEGGAVDGGCHCCEWRGVCDLTGKQEWSRWVEINSMKIFLQIVEEF